MNTDNPGGMPERRTGATGFTLTEVMIAVTIMAALVAIAVPMFSSFMEQQKITVSASDLRAIDISVSAHKANSGQYPTLLSEVPGAERKDPWGTPYEYLKIEGALPSAKGKQRKDKATNPINTDFDLYSMGRDGDTHVQLDNKAGKDDIVRGRNGDFFGLGADF